ncbi:MAG: NADPH:quinone oxidoreductase family protein [Pseudomonadota bacterium]
MRAMQLHALDTPLRLNEVPAPTPGPGEVLVDVLACGINFGDTLIVKGTYQEKFEMPFSPGMEISARIRGLGEGVSGLSVGQRVAAYGGVGGLAEQAVLKAAVCVPIPDAMSDVEAAAFLVAYGTSEVALNYKAALKPGERLLVLGAAGGVGLTAVELGKLMGAEVIACARGAEKLAIARAAGADHVIDSDEADIRAEVKALGGADVVYDPVGGDHFTAALRACNPEARILPLGFASGTVPQIPANIILVKNISVLGFYWGGYARLNPGVLTESFQRLFALYAEGRLKPHVSHVLPLDKANEALDLLRTRKATGKVVVRIGAEG